MDQLDRRIEVEDFGPQRDLRPADELPSVMKVLARVLGARSIVLTMHPSDGVPARVVAAVPPAESAAAELTLNLGRKILGSTGGTWPEWHTAGAPDQCCLMVALAEVAGHSRMVLGFHFDALTPEQRSRADAYVTRQPFADGYFDLWQLSRLRDRRCAALEEALDRTDDGVILISRDTRILFANAAAEAMIASGQGLRRSRGTIRATNLADSVNLQMTLEHVVAASAGDTPESERGGQVLALRRGAGPPLLLLVVPSDTPPVETTDTAAVIYLADPKLDPGRMLLPICQVYGFSPVETKLVGHLASGRSLAVAAEEMKIREHTARSYLKNIFIKTSTNRQTEVVALLLSSLVHVKQSALKNVGFSIGRRSVRLHA